MLGRVRVPEAVFRVVKEAARHLLRRPVIGIAAAARTRDGRWLLIRRGDSGGWALPGGTLEWGETLRSAIERELREETGADVVGLGGLLGIYSRPDRDPRFHAVTVLVEATVTEPLTPPSNSVEILEVRAFSEQDLPTDLSHGMQDMLDHAKSGQRFWE
jgi:8-oxo-dGTP diphosphatase